jgi:hypothetical protein
VGIPLGTFGAGFFFALTKYTRVCYNLGKKNGYCRFFFIHGGGAGESLRQNVAIKAMVRC